MSVLALALTVAALIASTAIAAPTPQEQEMVNQFLKKTEKKHKAKKARLVLGELYRQPDQPEQRVQLVHQSPQFVPLRW